MLQSVCFFYAVEKAVMHGRYLAKVNFLGIKPQIIHWCLSVVSFSLIQIFVKSLS
jgi:hypothetical protein